MSNKLPPLPVGVAPGSGYWNDWYEKLRTLINSFAAGFPFSSITNTPTTLSGYGITDGVPNTRTISTTAPLTGGGDLSANRTLAISQFAGGSPGSVPTSLGGTTNFLRADGSWAAPSGGGGGGSSLTQVTGTDANVTMAVNSLYVLDGSILTADRTYTLPATAAVGDRVGIVLSVGSSSYEVTLTASSGDTLSGIAGGTEWSRIFITNEVVIMQCTVANTTWVVDQDGRRATATRIDETSATTMSHATFTKISVDSVNFNVGNIGDATNFRVNARRAGVYAVAAMSNVNASDVDTRVVLRIYVNGTGVVELTRSFNRITGATAVGSGSTLLSVNAGDYIELYALWSVGGGSGTKTTDVSAGARPFLAVNEVL